ncbi:hypothetical protein [Streptomyces graminofaciens]|uniref:hypothetical protein n=1 Tax=Streptomyces graminofaciens TaxID=68212 RepID=UPI0025743A37|nr:hypothetical protein [Streptomyces graminofaciens]
MAVASCWYINDHTLSCPRPLLLATQGLLPDRSLVRSEEITAVSMRDAWLRLVVHSGAAAVQKWGSLLHLMRAWISGMKPFSMRR